MKVIINIIFTIVLLVLLISVSLIFMLFKFESTQFGFGDLTIKFVLNISNQITIIIDNIIINVIIIIIIIIISVIICKIIMWKIINFIESNVTFFNDS